MDPPKIDGIIISHISCRHYLGDLIILDSVTSMMDSIFSNRSSRLRLLVTPGSLAEEYVKKNRIDYAEKDAT